jgi:hypothetical protein
MRTHATQASIIAKATLLQQHEDAGPLHAKAAGGGRVENISTVMSMAMRIKAYMARMRSACSDRPHLPSAVTLIETTYMPFVPKRCLPSLLRFQSMRRFQQP